MRNRKVGRRLNGRSRGRNNITIASIHVPNKQLNLALRVLYFSWHRYMADPPEKNLRAMGRSAPVDIDSEEGIQE